MIGIRPLLQGGPFMICTFSSLSQSDQNRDFLGQHLHTYMGLSSQQGSYGSLTAVYPVGAHRGYPQWYWPRFSYGT